MLEVLIFKAHNFVMGLYFFNTNKKEGLPPELLRNKVLPFEKVKPQCWKR